MSEQRIHAFLDALLTALGNEAACESVLDAFNGLVTFGIQQTLEALAIDESGTDRGKQFRAFASLVETRLETKMQVPRLLYAAILDGVPGSKESLHGLRRVVRLHREKIGPRLVLDLVDELPRLFDYGHSRLGNEGAHALCAQAAQAFSMYSGDQEALMQRAGHALAENMSQWQEPEATRPQAGEELYAEALQAVGVAGALVGATGPGRPRRLERCYQLAVDTLRRLPAPPGDGTTAWDTVWPALATIQVTALLHRSHGDHADNLEEALETSRHILDALPFEDAARRAVALNNLGLAFQLRVHGQAEDNLFASADALGEAARLHAEGGAVAAAAMALNNQGLSLAFAGAHADALAALRSALRYFSSLRVREGVGKTLNNIGLTHVRRGLPDDAELAIEALTRALDIRTLAVDPEGFASSTLNLARAYLGRLGGSRMDDEEEAIRLFQVVADVQRAETFPFDHAVALYELAEALESRTSGSRAHNLEQAIDALEEALTLVMASNPSGAGPFCSALGSLYVRRLQGSSGDNAARAMALYRQALATADHSGRAHASLAQRIGLLARAAGRPTRVAESLLLDAASSYHLIGDTLEFVATLQELAAELARSGRQDHLPDVLAPLVQTVTARQAPGEAESLTRTLEGWTSSTPAGDVEPTQDPATDGDIARVHALAASIHHMLNSVGVEGSPADPASAYGPGMIVGLNARHDGDWPRAVRGFRTAVQATDARRAEAEGSLQREAVVSDARLAYDGLVDALVHADRPLDAMNASDACKAGELRDLIESVRADSGTSPRRRVASLRAQLRGVRERACVDLLVPDSPHARPDLVRTAERLQAELDQAELDPALARAEASLAHAGAPWPTESPSAPPSPAIAFHLGADGLTAFCCTGPAVQALRIDPAPLLEALDGGAAGRLTPDSTDEHLLRIATALRLDDLVAAFPASVRHVVLVPHGVLHLVPFAALPLRSGRRLLDRFPDGLSEAPSLFAHHACRETPETPLRSISVMDASASDLPWAQAEADLVATRTDGTLVPPTADALLAHLATEPHGFHFAGHALFDPGAPFTSRLCLPGGHALDFPEIIGLPFHRTSLVVLSACETGLSDALRRSEEVVGFPAAFLGAGVRSVLSSRWRVDDFATALLMDAFYGTLVHADRPVTVPSALAESQRWLRGASPEDLSLRVQGIADRVPFHPGLVQDAHHRLDQLPPSDAPFRHPFYWAGFYATGA